VVLRAPPKLAPHQDDRFLIIDQNLAEQTVSRHAEGVSSVARDTSFGARLKEFLIPAEDDSGIDMAQLVGQPPPVARPERRLGCPPWACPRFASTDRISS
jgi:hypothetical protein